MINEVWEPDMTAVFVSPAVLELSETLGFSHLHPRDRFWELLETAEITPKRVITSQERKALADGHAEGSLSDPVRLMFIEKKTSQLLRLGIGLAELNRREVAAGEKDPRQSSGAPSQNSGICDGPGHICQGIPEPLSGLDGHARAPAIPDGGLRGMVSRFDNSTVTGSSPDGTGGSLFRSG
jgi:hypothetical protein